MKAAASTQIKQELMTQPPKRLVELCMRLARFKKENKELLSYLLFDAEDEQGYVESLKIEITEAFDELPKGNWYASKKGLRRILRSIVKYSKYISNKEAEVELLLHFTTLLKESGIPYKSYKALASLYDAQIKKLIKLIPELHEDLHFDYIKKVEELQEKESSMPVFGKVVSFIKGKRK